MLKICFINFINYSWPTLAAHCHQSVSFLSALNSTNAANASDSERSLSRFAGGVDDWNFGMVSASGHLSGEIFSLRLQLLWVTARSLHRNVAKVLPRSRIVTRLDSSLGFSSRGIHCTGCVWQIDIQSQVEFSGVKEPETWPIYLAFSHLTT